jgi:3-deoxy-D-manno-octulosonic-acid transferase
MARRPLSLLAYRASFLREPSEWEGDYTARPQGELVWIHLGAPEELPAFVDLARWLNLQRPGVSVLLTACENHVLAPPLEPYIFACTLPEDHPRMVARFLDFWRPTLGLWSWGDLRPNLVDETMRRGCAMHIVSAHEDGFTSRWSRWAPDVTRSLLKRAASISARSEAAKRLLARFVPRAEIIPALTRSPLTPAYEEGELEMMLERLKARPAWLAAESCPAEWPRILAAHRQALRISHKLLLILHVRGATQMAQLREMLEQSGLTYALRLEGASLTEQLQVLVEDDASKLGLWYRLASLSFLGSTLVEEPNATDPMPAAALGTALLCGPHTDAFEAEYLLLSQAGAARMAHDAQSLGMAIIRTIAPDEASRMAYAAWDVVTQSAQSIDQLVELVQDGLDDAAALQGAGR